jgi:hypothetical protein
MSTKALSFALAAAIIALPLPASQLLAASAPLAPKAEIATGLSHLLADPFLIDQLSFERPADLKALIAAKL